MPIYNSTRLHFFVQQSSYFVFAAGICEFSNDIVIGLETQNRVTSVIQHFHPTVTTVLPSSDTSDLRQLWCYQYHKDLAVSVAHKFVGHMHILLQVGCTLFVGWIYTFCRTDAHFVQVGCQVWQSGPSAAATYQIGTVIADLWERLG